MSTLTFAETHNMVAFLEKPAESDRFHEIINFLNANQICYALTVNHTIYTSCIEQFWATAKANTVNGERQLQALVDKKRVIITESSIRSDLHLADAGGIDCTKAPKLEYFAGINSLHNCRNAFLATYSNEEKKEFSTVGAEHSTVIPEVSTAANLVYIRRSAQKRKDKGKAIIEEDESVPEKTKESS
ncbi:hypothetical protein Tco_0216497 [Tanacetum coccineum]